VRREENKEKGETGMKEKTECVRGIKERNRGHGYVTKLLLTQ
jgi:hypothetical protein